MIVRKPAVAGLFYPSDPSKLEKKVKELLEQEENDKEEIEAFGVISPHAGYIYSGKVAGKVFSKVKVPDKVLILCPNHTGYGADVSLFPDGVWEFPGFSVETDKEINSFLIRQSDIFELDTGAHFKEHSAEVIVPFLHFKNKKVKISVICIRTLNLKKLKKIGEAISNLKDKYNVLVTASSDMNHYEVDDVSRKKDMMAIEKIKNIDPEGLYEVVLEKNISICGIAPILSLLFSAKEKGIRKADLVAYSNSGEITLDLSSVVGYAGIVIY
jgi:hypothetical protein